MNISTHYRTGVALELKPLAQTPPKTDIPDPDDSWDLDAPAYLKQILKVESETTKGSDDDPFQPTLTQESAPSTIFQEDDGPRSYFESFDKIEDLAKCPADFLSAWESRIKMHPARFIDRLLQSDRVDPSSGDVSLESQGHQMSWLEYNLELADPASGESLGSMSREIDFEDPDTPRVYHNYFQLASGHQGKGLGKEILASSVKVYDEIGVKSISLNAGLDVGGYAWAKYGFKPKSGVQTEWLFDNLRDRLDDLAVSTGVRRTVERLLSDNKPEAIWAISDLNGVTVQDRDGPVPLGKALLLGTNWEGSLDLKCPDSRARFDQYINGGGPDDSPKGA